MGSLVVWLCFVLSHEVLSMSIDVAKIDTLQDMEQSDSNTKKEPVTCFCNLSECVRNGYMCKSETLGCFSDLTADGDLDKSYHGCLELVDRLPGKSDRKCQNIPSFPMNGVKGSLLLCCYDDMCNHVDVPETRMKYNETILAIRRQNAGNMLMMMKQGGMATPTYTYSSQEVWFKAATIAVPICGALILLLLIILAVKMLRADPQQVLAPKFGCKRNFVGQPIVGHGSPVLNATTCPNSNKVPFLFQQNDMHKCCVFLEKNQENAKLNLTATDKNLIDLAKESDPGACNLFQPTSPLLPQVNGGLLQNGAYNYIPNNPTYWPSS